MTILKQLEFVATADAWAAAGFRVTDGCVYIAPNLCIRLIGGDAAGSLGITLAIPGVAPTSGLSLCSHPLHLDADVSDHGIQVAHPNGVTKLEKLAIRTADIDAAVATLLTQTGEFLGQPPLAGKTPDGARYAIWPLGGAEVGFELYQVPGTSPGAPPVDSVTLMLVVDDLDAAVATVKSDLLGPRSKYGGRDVVAFMPQAQLGRTVLIASN